MDKKEIFLKKALKLKLSLMHNKCREICVDIYINQKNSEIVYRPFDEHKVCGECLDKWIVILKWLNGKKYM